MTTITLFAVGAQHIYKPVPWCVSPTDDECDYWTTVKVRALLIEGKTISLVRIESSSLRQHYFALPIYLVTFCNVHLVL